MKRRSRRDQDVALPSAPGWMTTYADLVTNMLCLFVLLFAFSQVDVARFQEVIISVQGALGVLDGGSSLTPEALPGGAGDDVTLQWQAEQQRLEEIAGEIKEFVSNNDLEKKVQVWLDERGLMIRFLDTALFDLGQAELKPEAIDILDNIAKILITVPNRIRVEGHTDDWPINTYRFPSNWELSTARATTVVRYFLENYGFTPEQFSAAGYGEWHPVVPNDSPEHRAQNRRVDIVILRASASLEEPPYGMLGEGGMPDE
ncbi:MAG: OmpA family protein [Firmicutes bacterium]|jgi:chemotaxis protein MotB|nr:OmpA family protein [Bacillota bacterium]